MIRYTLIVCLFLFVHCKNNSSMQKESPVTIHAFRLTPGKDLRKEIELYVQHKNIEAGYIITCVGSLTQTHLRYANQPNGEMNKGYVEIVSLTGTVSIYGNHLHMSVSDSTGRTIGGHLLHDNLVYTTAEIIIGENENLRFRREKDGTTPWEELQIQEKK